MDGLQMLCPEREVPARSYVGHSDVPAEPVDKGLMGAGPMWVRSAAPWQQVEMLQGPEPLFPWIWTFSALGEGLCPSHYSHDNRYVGNPVTFPSPCTSLPPYPVML